MRRNLCHPQPSFLVSRVTVLRRKKPQVVAISQTHNSLSHVYTTTCNVSIAIDVNNDVGDVLVHTYTH
jgi:hypothetical protein